MWETLTAHTSLRKRADRKTALAPGAFQLTVTKEHLLPADQNTMYYGTGRISDMLLLKIVEAPLPADRG
jgi:hypothetical protein